MLFIQEAVNLYAGDDTPNASKHHNLKSIKLPTLEEISETHHAGGSIGEVTIGGLGMKALEITFALAGWDPQTLSLFGLWSRGRMPYTMYGLIRDKSLQNKAIEVKSIAWGRMGKIEQSQDFERGQLLGHDHMLHELFRYAVYYDGKEKYYYDWETGDWRVDGVSQNADERRILRIPGS